MKSLQEAGAACLQEGDWSGAREAFEACLAAGGASAPVLALLALAHLRLGNLEQALDAITRAVDLRPEHDGYRHNRGVVLTALGRYREAVADYERAIALNPESGGSHNNLAWLLATAPDASIRDGSRAVAHARRAVAMGENGAWLDTLAAALAETGAFDEAVEVARRAYDRSSPRNEAFRKRMELYRRGITWAEWRLRGRR